MTDIAQLLKDQEGHLTATDVARVLNISKWGGRLDVYNAKIDGRPYKEETPAMRRGNLFEGWILAQVGSKPWTAGLLTHATEPWAGCHPDGGRSWPRSGGPAILDEVKTIGAFSDRSAWGTAGSQDVPVDYWCQVRWQMIIAASHLFAAGGAQLHAAFMSVDDDTAIELAMSGRHHEAVAEIVPYDFPQIDSGDADLLSEMKSFWFGNVEALVPPTASADASVPRNYPLKEHYREVRAEGALEKALANLRALKRASDASADDLKEARELVEKIANRESARKVTHPLLKTMSFVCRETLDKGALIDDLRSLAGISDDAFEAMKVKHSKAGKGSWTITFK